MMNWTAASEVAFHDIYDSDVKAEQIIDSKLHTHVHSPWKDHHVYLYLSKNPHMERQEMKMKWKLEMQTGNRNWKQKWKQKHSYHWHSVFFTVMTTMLCHYYILVTV